VKALEARRIAEHHAGADVQRDHLPLTAQRQPALVARAHLDVLEVR
jgi:hypothetical protein